MRLRFQRLTALRRGRPAAAVAAVLTAGLLGLAAVAITVGVAGSAARPAAQPMASASPSYNDGVLTPAIADFADFRVVQGKPQAAAPIRRLPHVRLASISVDGIPPVPMAAYRSAALSRARVQPACHLPWWLLAGIGLVESGHARSGGSGYVGWNGVARPPIYGPVLDGHPGYKAIPDTDHGRLDGDPRWDRAVGPMQFLPATWTTWGPPGRFEGRANPENIFSAANAAAGYLCASGSDLSQPHAMALAVYSYNHSFDYVRLVLSVGARYAGMTPDQLGVNLLPKDHPKAKNGTRKKQRERHSGSVRGADRATAASASPSPSPSPSAWSSPSPSPTPYQPLPNPLPTLTPPIMR